MHDKAVRSRARGWLRPRLGCIGVTSCSFVFACLLVIAVPPALAQASTVDQGRVASPTESSAAAGPRTQTEPPPDHVSSDSAGCESVGTVAEQIATWRDAHGSEYLANIEVQRRLTDASARDAALSIVSQLYTGFAKNLSPQQAKQAYAAACEAGDAQPVSPAVP